MRVCICWCDCIVCLVSLLVTWKKFSDFSVCLAIQSISVDQSYTASTYIQPYRAVVPHHSTTLTKVCVVVVVFVVDDVVFCVCFFILFYFSSIDSNFFSALTSFWYYSLCLSCLTLSLSLIYTCSVSYILLLYIACKFYNMYSYTVLFLFFFICKWEHSIQGVALKWTVSMCNGKVICVHLIFDKSNMKL